VLGHARHPLGDHGSCALAGEQQKGRAPQSFCVRGWECGVEWCGARGWPEAGFYSRGQVYGEHGRGRVRLKVIE
jgi:hypothetical protein